MYKYEELDFNQIINDSNIDMDSPEALYAIARCYRDGKGVEKSEERYQEYLQEAIEQGMEVPEESNSFGEPEADIPQKSWEQAAFATSDEIAECEKQAESGNADACLALYEFCREIDDAMAETYIQMAQDNASGADAKMQQRIYIAAAEWYEEEEKYSWALDSYKRAVESGSIDACWDVCRYYENEGDSAERRDKLEYYRGKIIEFGTNEELFRLAMIYKDENALVKALGLLERVYQNVSDDTDLKTDCLLEMIQLAPARYPADRAVSVLWDVADREDVCEKLTQIYGTDPNQTGGALLEALKPKQVICLASWYLEHQNIAAAEAWVGCAKEDPDGSAASLKEKICAAKAEAERLRREEEKKERERQQKEAKEAERLRKEREQREKEKWLQQKKVEQERLQREKAEQERQRRELEEQEKRQKEQERQAQIAAEKNRKKARQDTIFLKIIPSVVRIVTVLWFLWSIIEGFLDSSNDAFKGSIFLVIVIACIIFVRLRK